MHFSLFEKVGASLLIVAWLIYGANFLGRQLVHVESVPSALAVADHGAPSGSAATAAQPADLGTLLAAATPAAGEKVFGKCKACHGIEKGGPAKVGPNLWNVVGGPMAHMQGFAYSSGLAQMGAKGDKWGYDQLDTYLTNPKGLVAGTKMTFAGLSSPEDRAAVIQYLRANSENPPPLPEPKPQAAAPAPAQQTAVAAKPVEVAAPAAPVDAVALIASADPALGEKVFGKCKACHNAEKGGPNAVGPNLWDIVGHKKAAHDGYSYSAALKALPGDWTYKDLDAYLASPKQFAGGTKMTFAGLSKPEERAAVIAYLRSRSDSPKPLP
jgi:cytochrome c